MSSPFFLPLVLAAGAYGGSLFFHAARRRGLGLGLLVAGLALHTFGLVARAWYRGVFTPSNVFTEPYFLPWCLAALAVWLRAPPGKPGDALALLAPVCLFSALALLLPAVTPPPLPTSSTPFAPAFHLLEALAHALFILGGWLALLFLLGRTGETTFKSLVIWGFVAYSAAQIVGAIWCYLGWTVPFHWSERHLMSAAVWCLYCACLHLHFSRRWAVRERAWLSMAGSALVLVAIFSYYAGAISTFRVYG